MDYQTVGMQRTFIASEKKISTENKDMAKL
jgi:hypothetical protein